MAPSFTRTVSTPSGSRGVLVLAHRHQPGAEAAARSACTISSETATQREHDPVEGARLWNWNASGRRSSLISVPTPAPVIGATLAMMRSTSAKASVTSAKYEPRSP